MSTAATPPPSIYDGLPYQTSISTQALDSRLASNAAHGRSDFHAWFMARAAAQPGHHVLDIGCGTGAQALRMLEAVGPTGSVSALDLSASSIAQLQAAAGPATNLQAVAADMAHAAQVIEGQFDQKAFDLAYSVYSLYYSPMTHTVLDAMRTTLRPTGRMVIFTPYKPHGFIDFVERYGGPIDRRVKAAIDFGPHLLEPYFLQHFEEVQIHFYRNPVRLPNLEAVREFYRNSVYFDPQAEPAILAAAARDIDGLGYFPYEKNGYLIRGEVKR